VGQFDSWTAFLPLVCVFRAVYFDSIYTRPSLPVHVTTAGPSTPQIIAFAMICSGRDDGIEKIEHPHSSQNQA
jgi:hypothetical protein